MAKKQRLTDRLNIALAKVSASVAIGRDNPEHSQACCREAVAAINEAQEIMGEIRRAAELI